MFGLSLRASLAALSAASLVLALALGSVSLWSLSAIETGARALHDDILPRVASADAMSVAMSNLRISEAEHVSSANEAAKRRAEAAIAEANAAFDASIAKYRANSGANDADHAAMLDMIQTSVEKYRVLSKSFVEFSSTYREIDAGALFVSRMKGAYDQIAAPLHELIVASGRDAELARAANADVYNRSLSLVIGFLAVALLVAGASAGFGFFAISRPLGLMRDAMVRMAGGDLTASAPQTDPRHEIGAMAAAIEVFKDGLVRARQLEAETADARAGAEAQRRAATQEMARRFEGAVGGIVSTVSAASTELQATAVAMTGAAGQTASQSSQVASAAEDAAANVTLAAEATERLGHAVRDIGRQVEQSSRLAQATVDDAQATGRLVTDLSDAAAKIGDVVEMISTIAGQTNLLALNATIEAARAGEAGRGFAIVASEVKNLAAQTATATDEITRQIAGIQGASRDAVEAIQAIDRRIREMSETAAAISGAVEIQEAATRDIVSTVSRAASGASEVKTNIAGVSAAAGHTGAAAAQVLQAASELSRQSEHLEAEVGRFLSSVRAA